MVDKDGDKIFSGALFVAICLKVDTYALNEPVTSAVCRGQWDERFTVNYGLDMRKLLGRQENNQLLVQSASPSFSAYYSL